MKNKAVTIAKLNLHTMPIRQMCRLIEVSRKLFEDKDHVLSFEKSWTGRYMDIKLMLRKK